MLCGDLVPTDGEIIEEISSTCMVDLEHKSKLAGLTGSRRQKAVSSQSDSDSTDSNTPAKKQRKKKEKSKNSSSSQDRSDTWVAELTSMLVPILDPITARVNSLTGDMEKLMSQQPPQQQVQSPQLMQIQPIGQQPQPQQYRQPLNPSAPGFNGVNVAGGQPVSDHFVPRLYYNQQQSMPQGGRGRGRGRGQSGGLGAGGLGAGGLGAGGLGGTQGIQLAKFRCPKCVEENAVFCNHCKTCWRIDHRTAHCPHKGDPTFVPSKNC